MLATQKCPLFGGTPCISLGTHALVHSVAAGVTNLCRRRWRTPVALVTLVLTTDLYNYRGGIFTLATSVHCHQSSQQLHYGTEDIPGPSLLASFI